MECLAIIPARGGSKGIPRKNVLPIAGKPLIAYNIQQALFATQVDRVVVSTDDTEIAATARRYGAEVVWRPAEISGDTASSESALLHTLKYLRGVEDYRPDILVFLQCTSPLTLAEDIDGTVNALLNQDADTALSVIPFHYFLWKPDRTGNATGVNHDKHVRPLRQEQEQQYLETGAVYVMRVTGFLEAQHRAFGRTALYIMPHERRLEIDEPVDFQIAEMLLRQQETTRITQRLPEKIAALVLDFDGVFTDNKVLVSQDHLEAVLCDRSDGWGIGQLKKTGLPILILSSEKNPVVKARADKLAVPCLYGVQSKWPALETWLAERNIHPAQVIYVGNDDNDLPSMQQVGCSVAVADAYPGVLAQADLVLKNRGGNGAVREICDLILHSGQINQGV